MANAIHIHEDDWGLRSIYPLAAFDELQVDLKASAQASEANRGPSGHGWADLYEIQEPQKNFLSSKIPLAEIENRISSILPRVPHFSATSSAYIGRSGDEWGSYNDNPWCFGLSSSCYIYLNDVDGYLESICFEFDSSRDDWVRMCEAFALVETLEPSLLIDYRMKIGGPLGEQAFLDRYFGLISDK